MIRNIVFDMGNVVIRFDPVFFLDRAGITDEDDRMLVMNELFLSVEWAQMDLGTLTEESAEPLIIPRFPERLRENVRTLLYHWAYPRDMVSGMEELISRLKKAGYGIYLLSNASVAQHDYWPKYTVSRLFDGKLISCDVKTVKPCHRIYRLFTEKFRIKDPRKKTVYCLTNFNSTMEENLYRIYTLSSLGYDPYVMVYDKPHAPKEIKRLQRWCNNKIIFKKVPRFEDYSSRKG